MKKFIESIPKDVYVHILFTILLGEIVALFSSITIGIEVTFIVGVLKELIYDLLLKKGMFQLHDFIGNLVGLVILFLQYFY